MAHADTPSRLFARYGESLTLRQESAGSYDANAGEYTSAPTQTDSGFIGYLEPFKSSLVNGTTVQAGDLECWAVSFPSGVEPAAGDKLLRNTRVYRVVSVNPSNVGSVVSVWRLQVRGV